MGSFPVTNKIHEKILSTAEALKAQNYIFEQSNIMLICLINVSKCCAQAVCVCWPKSTETETETETDICRCANSTPSWLYAYISLLQYAVEFMLCFFSTD